VRQGKEQGTHCQARHLAGRNGWFYLGQEEKMKTKRDELV
jgi:hypothetical protein